MQGENAESKPEQNLPEKEKSVAFQKKEQAFFHGKAALRAQDENARQGKADKHKKEKKIERIGNFLGVLGIIQKSKKRFQQNKADAVQKDREQHEHRDKAQKRQKNFFEHNFPFFERKV